MGLRSVTAIGDALFRLEAALVEAEHPLATTRPIGRSQEELATASQEVLGRQLPSELSALWQWWGGSEFWPSRGERPGVFADQLPGGVNIESLEQAHRTTSRFLHDELIGHSQESLLPFATIGDGLDLFWFDSSERERPAIQVALHALEHPPPQPPTCAFNSIASWVNAMALMLETGRWCHDQSLGWHYPGPQRIWITEAKELAI